MYRFFVKQEQIDMEEKKIHITGSDVNHIKNVLRMRQGETILISAGLSYTHLQFPVVPHPGAVPYLPRS